MKKLKSITKYHINTNIIKPTSKVTPKLRGLRVVADASRQGHGHRVVPASEGRGKRKGGRRGVERATIWGGLQIYA